MNYHSPKYPYRVYIAGSKSFNNYYLYMYYIKEYITGRSFLYAPKGEVVDTMTRLYATMNNLCYQSCNVEKGLEQYHNITAVNSIISNIADMLIAFWDGMSEDIPGLEASFKSRKKKVIIIDINNNDTITPELSLQFPYTKKATIQDIFADTIFFHDGYRSNSMQELAMKFLSDAYRSKELMKLIIDNKTTDFIVNNKLDEAIKSLLTWIYNNQYEEIKSEYENMVEKELPAKSKRFSPDEFKHATKCEWKEEGEEVEVYTGTGLPLSTGYNSIVEYGNHSFIEIKDIQLIKSHIHKSMNARTMTEDEDNCVKVTYHTSDIESYPITYQVANFETSQFKMGYWYINTDFVTTVKP